MPTQEFDVRGPVSEFIGNVADEQWEVYDCMLTRARQSGFDFALGGAIAYAAYTGRVRDTKDLDVYVTPANRESAIQCLNECGMKDYYDELPYDRSWIYRGKRNGAIIDIIWAMANGRSQVTSDWLRRGPKSEARGQQVCVIPPEELVWSKLYVIQRERCDWPDVLNVVDAVGPEMDWDRLMHLLEDDRPLLRGLVSVYEWLSPDRARELPPSLWAKLQLPAPNWDDHARRVRLLDTRPWFGKPESPQ